MPSGGATRQIIDVCFIRAVLQVDIGCERSGNEDTGERIAEALKMNYFFACEFEVLTLTMHEDRGVDFTTCPRCQADMTSQELYSPLRTPRDQGGGIHGNAILSRFDFATTGYLWPILTSSATHCMPLPHASALSAQRLPPDFLVLDSSSLSRRPCRPQVDTWRSGHMNYPWTSKWPAFSQLIGACSLRVVHHQVEPVQWDDEGDRFKQPRRGRRVTPAVTLETPGAHVRCGRDHTLNPTLQLPLPAAHYLYRCQYHYRYRYCYCCHCHECQCWPEL